jgi:CubicO group peptidase (beta-lactamase class C family)
MLRLACVLGLIAGILLSGPALAGERYPGAAWETIEKPAELGWSADKLAAAKQYFDTTESSAFVLVDAGRIVVAWGDIEEPFSIYSVRKSLLSALYGVFAGEGKIDTGNTLKDLNIDDEDGLTDSEKTARVVDLLRARSGVYHPAAYVTRKMKERRPKRGAYAPGSHFYYNNWDFNALGTILRQFTGMTVYAAFEKRLAAPLRMQDYVAADQAFHTENVSRHPAYPFRMSARDLARFGLLFLRQGRWGDRQVIPKAWVVESTATHSQETGRRGVGYGYLWWTALPGKRHFKVNLGDGTYSARGNGGQYVVVIPSKRLVAVHLVDWRWSGKKVRSSEFGGLLKRVLGARPQT